MPVLSAADTIFPAIYRTRQFLFAPPFRWGTFLKLCLVAAITEGLGSNIRSSGNRGRHVANSRPDYLISHFSPEVIVSAIFAVALAIVITLFIVYLVTRLRFAYFHCLTHNVREIRPGWELYRPQAKRFFLMNIGVGICFLIIVALIALPFVAGFWRFYQGIHDNGGPNWALLISLILPLIPLLALIAIAGLMTDIILRDWMLPHYAIDDATAGQAWHEVRMRIKNEKKQFFVYSILRLIAPIVAVVGLGILLIIPSLVSVGAVAAAEYAVHSAFATSSGSANVAGIAIEVFIGCLAFAFAAVVGISLGGPLSTGLREYALLFYGGRYQALENVMFPPSPAS
ncbi:MAG TPA: hypothetical protein VGI45_23195 [Terracidiphilus sp.]|jgi:hypothetical protein